MPEVYAANVNSVVSINVSTTTNVFGRTTESAASGSGFFITKDGYILTNYHVIEGASTVKVTAYDGTTYDAAVIGGDEDYDIAVIKVEGTNFQPVVIGKSGSVQIGETVAAVGNPLGELTFSMSQGIVSCVTARSSASCPRSIRATPTPPLRASASPSPSTMCSPWSRTL